MGAPRSAPVSVAALALLASTLCVAPSLRAQPTWWARAREPRAVQTQALLVAVEGMLARASVAASVDPALPRRFTLAGLALLHLGRVEREGDPRLAFFLGELLVDREVERWGEARRVLTAALAREPEAPEAARAWFNLAIACDKLGDPGCARDAYDAALELTWEPEARANVLLNRGEAHMTLGQLEAALADYRAALTVARSPALVALAYYGLGVALERSGDLPAALRAMSAGNAIRVHPSIDSALDLPSVFFIPPYEVHYYRALAALAQARLEEQPEARRQGLEQAARHWSRYLEADAAAPWAGHARARRRALARELRALERRLGRGARARQAGAPAP